MGCPCERDVSLRKYASWRVGGPVDWLVHPESVAQLSAVLAACHERGVPILIIGHGTNLLFDDAGFRGVIIRIAENLSAFSIAGNRITAEAGVWVPQIARAAGRAGLAGLEHTIGIPGTLGGLVVMNGGSKRQSVGDCVAWVRVLGPDGSERTLTQSECQFAYRSSLLQRGGQVVAEVGLCCGPGDPAAMRREMLAILRDRNGKFPRKQPNCGSVFVGGGEMFQRFGPPGKVIEDTGLKGMRIGDAKVSEQHANFIVNLGEATSRDTLALIHLIRDRVHERTGLWLQCEVRYVSTAGAVLPASELATIG
ncbi:MAG: UDP-N-acetylmuramate dehydrogenase [Candidatus Hydrogenedentes bacterium]|nr:UDP-N-acetylmuramate dehydrogenase [Candidatus Hydrogenedentota bacterium]